MTLSRIFSSLIVCIFFLVLSTQAMGGVTVGKIGKQDLKLYDGTSQKTFERKSRYGGYDILNKVGFTVDALMVYGDGTEYTGGTIADAFSNIGTTNNVAVELASGTWVISTARDFSAYTNITLIIPAGAEVRCDADLTLGGLVVAGPNAFTDNGGTATLTIYSPENIIAGKRQQIFDFSGSGKVAFTVGGTVFPEHWKENTTPGTTDMTTAFVAASQALPLISGSASRRIGTLEIPAGYYVINDWNPEDDVDVQGSGTDATFLVGTTSHIINIPASRAASFKYATFRDLTFQPYDSGTYASVFTEASGKAVANVDFVRCRFDAPGKYGCYGYFNIVRWIECYFGNNNSSEKLISGIYLGGAGSANHKNTIRSNTFYYMSGPAIDMQGVAGVYCQDNVIDDNIFEQLDSMAINLYYAWGTKITNNYFEELNKVAGADADHECVIYMGTDTLGVTNIDSNHFTGSSINETEKIVSVLAGQQPYITLNWNQFGTAWNGLEMINNLTAQDRFWFLGNYHTGTPTFGSDASYRYFNNDRILNKVEQFAKPSNATLLAWQVQDTVITNLGQAGGGGATITLTLPTADEDMLFTAVISEVPGAAFYIKAGASDKIYLNGTALDDADKVGNLNAVAAIGDSIRFWTFETASGVYDWIAETVTGTWTDEGA